MNNFVLLIFVFYRLALLLQTVPDPLVSNHY